MNDSTISSVTDYTTQVAMAYLSLATFDTPADPAARSTQILTAVRDTANTGNAGTLVPLLDGPARAMALASAVVQQFVGLNVAAYDLARRVERAVIASARAAW